MCGDVMSDYILSGDIMSGDVMSGDAADACLVICWVMSCLIMSCLVMSCLVMSCQVMLVIMTFQARAVIGSRHLLSVVGLQTIDVSQPARSLTLSCFLNW